MIVWGLRFFPGRDITLVGQGMERYMTPSWGAHILLMLLANSFETLATNRLSSGKDLFKQLHPSFPVDGAAHTHFDLLLGKRVYPDEHLDSWEQMNEPGLAACEAFL